MVLFDAKHFKNAKPGEEKQGVQREVLPHTIPHSA